MDNSPINEALELLCDNLPTLRSMLNLTQQDLAMQIGTSRQAVVFFTSILLFENERPSVVVWKSG